MSASKDASGRWRYRKRVQLPDGRRVRIKGTPAHNSKAAAEGAERDHIHRLLHPEAAARIDPAKEVPTLREYSRTWMASYAAGKPSDRDSKEQILGAYILDALGDWRLDAIGQEQIDALVMRLLPTHARKTINNILSVVSSLVRYAVRNRLIADPGLTCHIETEDAELVAVPMGDVDKLLAAADDRYRVAVLLAAEAGLRVGEVRGLEWGDIDEINQVLRVARAVDPKGRTTAPKHWRSRRVPVSGRLWDALRALGQGDGRVVTTRKGRPISYWGIRDGVMGLYDAAKVEPPPQPWHSLRHTFGSELAARGVPVTVIKELMGHRSIQTTLRYVHVGDAAMTDAIRDAFGPDVGPRAKSRKRKARKST